MADIQPVKILFFHPTHTFGGAERTALHLLKGLDTERFRVTLVTSREIAPVFSGTALQKIIYVEDLGMDIWFGRVKTIWKDVRIAARLLKAEKPDIAFGMMHYSSAILAAAKKIFRIKAKVISSPRGPSSVYLKTCFTKKSERLFLGRLFYLFCRYSDGLIVPSAGTKEDCIKNYGARRERVRVINNSIDTADIKKRCREETGLAIPADAFIISTAGRLSMEKNIPLLFNAFAVLRQTEEARLLIIGEGSEKESLRALAKKLGMADDVVFLGFQENPYKYIKRSDVFVHTCLVEGFGNIIIEAMACGVPVIATDCPYGPREIIKNNENGVLVDMDDFEALAQAIRSLLQDTGRRKDLSEKGYLRSLDFSIEKMVSAYEEFFLQVAEGRSGQG